MAKYIVKHTTILHSKKTYAEGSVIDLKEEDAKRLADFLEAVPETTAKQNGSKTKTEKTNGEKEGGTDGEKTV